MERVGAGIVDELERRKRMYYGRPKNAPDNYCTYCHKATGVQYKERKKQVDYTCGVCGRSFSKLKSHHGNGSSNKDTNKL